MARTRSSVGAIIGKPSPQPRSMASTMNASVSSSASIDSLTSGSTEGAEGDEDVAVRVCSNGSHLLFRSSLQRVWEHNHGEARMPVVRGDPSAMRLELRGDHDHG